MKTRFLLPVLLGCQLAAGCRAPSAHCRVCVANATDVAIPSVVVRDDAGTAYAFANVAPHGRGACLKARADMGVAVSVEVGTPQGAVVTNAVRLEKPVPATFDGGVLFQVEAGPAVRAFVLQKPDSGAAGDMPWAVPPPWQGVVGIPGMSGRE